MKSLNFFTYCSNIFKWTFNYFLTVILLIIGNGVNGQGVNKELEAHFANQPIWWQTSICLPDDPYKTLVSREGELLYDYDGPFYKSLTGGFKTTVGLNSNQAWWCSPDKVNPGQDIRVF